MINVALIEPEIPQNTGNIGRLCVSSNTALHLVKPLGFSLSDKYMKRAGLDYWPHLSWFVHDSVEKFLADFSDKRLIFTCSSGGVSIHDYEFAPGDTIVFGRESVGLPQWIFEKYADNLVTIPMIGKTRSLNLANSVGIVMYEALRQLDQKGYEPFGNKPNLRNG
jgi:tRNA (cytidine/uridine-2'-O-)-methyltransferase